MPKTNKTTKSRFKLGSDIPNASNSRSKVGRKAYKGMSGAQGCLKTKKRSYAKLEAKTVITSGYISLDLPIKTKSEANCFEPWRLKHARHKQQQRIIALALAPHRHRIGLPCLIKLTRFAPFTLDNFDNLPMSFKYIVDAICSVITGEYRAGKADSDKRITIACDQVKSKEYGIRIEITHEGD